MGGDSALTASSLSGPALVTPIPLPPLGMGRFVRSVKENKSQKWAPSPSQVFYHFGTSGTSVAVATGITHPLGDFLFPPLSIYCELFLAIPTL
ncbi:hypothetical protein CRG98_020202 [Punica granatum]|uniref:Uncharacterized protein n=1 Tax=Punica granatum TaxID=22663 RepID=A0A2I0JU91_PUNGR|nr:hypothetical protein CRG98_020202 [Punica granatum]